MPPEQLLNGPTGARTSYWLGRRLLVRGELQPAVDALRACLVVDGEIALVLVALALALRLSSDDDALGATVLARAELAARRGISRRERQHVAIVALALRGEVSRASALGREHLAEFPDDSLIAFVLRALCDDDC